MPRASDSPETLASPLASSPGAVLPDKVYFRIGEVAKLLRVEPHVVRFWQEQFAAVRPERSSTGRFLYSRAAVERLQRIRKLLYDEGYTIAGAKKALSVPATPTPAAKPAESKPVIAPEQGRRLAEQQAEVQRLQREVRGLQARLEVSERDATALRQQREGPDARTRAELRLALDEATALTRLLDRPGR